jgi:hypothetical protein
MIHRCIAWRNRNTAIVASANRQEGKRCLTRH